MAAPLGSLHVDNHTRLLWLREECRGDLAVARRVFGLEPSDAEFYRDLDDESIEALGRELDVALLVPRFDGRELATVMETRPAFGGRPAPTRLELHNLLLLNELCEACRFRRADAVWVHRINEETARVYAGLDPARAFALSRALTISAFVPRYDAVEAARILRRPAGVRALFAATYERDITPPDKAAPHGLAGTH